MEQWLIIYRGYSDDELALEVEWLRKQVRNPFGSQTEGNRSVTRSTAEMRDRLAAATQVATERAAEASAVPGGGRHLIADFSKVQVR